MVIRYSIRIVVISRWLLHSWWRQGDEEVWEPSVVLYSLIGPAGWIVGREDDCDLFSLRRVVAD